MANRPPQIPPESRAPIVVVSASEGSTAAADALRHRAVAYLPQPCDPCHVDTLVTTLFDSAEGRDTKPNAPR